MARRGWAKDLKKALFLFALALAGLPVGWALRDYGLIHLASATLFAEALYFAGRYFWSGRTG